MRFRETARLAQLATRARIGVAIDHWDQAVAISQAAVAAGSTVQLLVEVDEANAATLLKMIDALEDDDDVQTVWGNYDMSDEVMAKLG